jgi:FkbM family methyltransferase
MLHPFERLKTYIDCANGLGGNLRNSCSIFWRETKNVRVRLGLAAYHPNEVYALKTIYGPLYFRDNFGDITNLPGMFHQNEYRSKALAEDGVILDVGANIGLAAAWFALHNPGRPIYCFEPLAANVALITRNCPTAIVEQVAVGACHGRVKLRVDPDSVIASLIPCWWETKDFEFEVISLDEFTSERGIERVALLKIDVEGMETEVLKGSEQTLKRTSRVAMETHGTLRHDQVMKSLRQSGFQIDAQEFDGGTGLVFAVSATYGKHGSYSKAVGA